MKKVGKIKDAHGIKGDLYVLIFSGEVSWSQKLTHFYLSKAKSNNSATASSNSPNIISDLDVENLIKYSVDLVKPHKDGLIIRAIQCKNRNEAEALRGFDFFIDDDLLISKSGETIFLNEILGFELLDSSQESIKSIGTISGFSSNGPQDLLQVKIGNKTAEIPFVAPLIENINFESRKIQMRIPEGLLEIYLD